MSALEKTKILIVDDQPSKLLSLEAILGDLDEALIKARSAEDALKALLTDDVAVVLMDICMPGMNGFELAELIRDHPRFKRTAIIFISAVHLSEDDRLRGYGLGAVDYISLPIIPEVLRAKVAVFVDLFRKSKQLENLNRDLERRVAERTSDLEMSNARLRESERRYRELAEALPAAVYTTDAEGRITLCNEAARSLWGKAPRLGEDRWCGSLRIFSTDGLPLAFEDCPMAVTLREGRVVRGQDVIIERPDRSRRVVMPHPELMRDEDGVIVGTVNMLMDITEQREAHIALRESEENFRTLADNISHLVWMADAQGNVFWLNQQWLSYTGATHDELCGRGWTALQHPDHAPRSVAKLTECFRFGKPWEDTVALRGRSGQYRWFLSHAFPTRDESGAVIRWFCTCTDVTEQREAQQVLSRDRETLEDLVARRTEELERTNERLRLNDRMATIGTLSAGLGHDIGNLLLPVRMHLDAIEAHELPAEVRADVEAIRTASEYLQRLAKSLRLLSLDAESERPEDAATDLVEWWADAEGMIRNGVLRPTVLASRIAEGVPKVQISKPALTQVVFNLVQNAGDALHDREGGRVLFEACVGESPGTVRISVSDNGPGMSEDARQRCTEPFFTTKTRGLSTGLGLALVSGLVKRVGGAVQIHSEPGRGTSVALILPAAAATSHEEDRTERAVAWVCLDDARLRAHVESTLSSFDLKVLSDPDDGSADAEIWVIDDTSRDASQRVRRFLGGSPRRRVILCADADAGADPPRGLFRVDPRARPSVLRAAIAEAVADESLAVSEESHVA